ncbi:MAG: hypothetical protein DWQ07_18460 [Chloroflexi bacterium]|nr:MAG: hypothetical protein DWQ07_18460 [Chloroflexota bacterium]
MGVAEQRYKFAYGERRDGMKLDRARLNICAIIICSTLTDVWFQTNPGLSKIWTGPVAMSRTKTWF